MVGNVVSEVTRARRNVAVLLGGILAALVLVLVLMAKPASAACPVGDPTCGGGGGTTRTIVTTLTVANNQPDHGKVTSSDGGINCGQGASDCTQNYSYIETCDASGSCSNSGVDTVSLSSSPAAGWSFSGWGGSCSGTGPCTLTMDADKSVSVSWADVQPPTVTLTSPSNNTKVGAQSVQATATASDNSGSIARIEFRVDGVAKATDTFAPYSAALDMSTYAEGDHTVSAWAYDPSGNVSIVSRTVTVDRHVSLSLGSVPSFTNASSVPLSFSTDPDVPASNIKCRVNSDPFTVCTSPFDPPLPNDGDYTYTIQVTDDVGNTASATRSFTVDRAAPTGTVKINVGAIYTRSPSVNLSLSATDPAPQSGVDMMRLMNDGGSWSAWMPYATSKSWTLKKANGTRTVYAQYKDKAGNVSTIALDRIMLDALKPTISAMSPKPASIIHDTTPTIKATVKDNTTLKKSNIKLYVAGQRVTRFSYRASKLTYTSPKLSKGKKVVKIVAGDAAGNVGAKIWYFTIKK